MATERVDRRLAAVLAADVAGYSRLMGANEEDTLARLKAVRKILVDPAITSHRGRIVKTTGDGMLVEFASAVDAVRSAIEVQRSMAEQNAAVPQDQRIEFRIGIHVGDIIFDDNDIFGDGVNIAARLEGIAEHGGVCISDDTYRQIRGKVDIACDDLGPQNLKNIADPMRAWRVRLTNQASSTAQCGSGIAAPAVLALPDKPSIAVLPFQNMSGDPEQEYFADGMVEDIITALSRFNSLFVIARNSSFTYKGKAVDIKRVGRELGVRYVLEGSVRKAGGRVRITGQLIDASSGAHLWADRIDGELTDVFELQDRITASVVSSIAPKIELAEIERVRQNPTNVPDSYDSYLQGMALASRGQGAEARRLFKRAIEQDPRYAAAYAMAAYTYLVDQAQHGAIADPGMRADAVALANAALKLANQDAFVLARSAQALTYLGLEYDRGASLVEQAIALNPNLSVAWLARCWVSVMRADAERGIESFEKVMRLSPLDPLKPFFVAGVAHCHWFQGRFEEGRELAREAIQIRPHLQPFASYIVNSVALGDLPEAREAARRLLEFDPSFRMSGAAAIFLIRSPEYREKFLGALRTAGLPD
ncbi:adenylate/guanylate cyclase domain-containing protein [Bradyrhizobium sp. AZCC 2289]|uniref:adenylate/guanylate cyclase domain-containing protein n=1 Tax=Bradyrhizobium sp. AZCC 2289 TaxID=3117026 RepID=UPI002FEE7797